VAAGGVIHAAVVAQQVFKWPSNGASKRRALVGIGRLGIRRREAEGVGGHEAERVLDRGADVAVGGGEQSGYGDGAAQSLLAQASHGATVGALPCADRQRRRQDRVKA
jgi:hypothetical protein